MGGQELRVGAAAVVEEHLPNLGVWCHVITARGEGGGRYDSSRGHDRSPSFWGVVKARAGARLRFRLIDVGRRVEVRVRGLDLSSCAAWDVARPPRRPPDRVRHEGQLYLRKSPCRSSALPRLRPTPPCPHRARRGRWHGGILPRGTRGGMGYDEEGMPRGTNGHATCHQRMEEVITGW